MKTLLPGSTIGMLGGGQLGRMFAFEAKRMGYNIIVLDPSSSSPAAQVADSSIEAAFSDVAAVQQLADAVDVITYEFENVPVDVLQKITTDTPVYPSARLLQVAQHRLTEKTFAEESGIPVPQFSALDDYTDGVSSPQVQVALSSIGLPAVLKTTRLGYDGKGQWVVHTEEELATALTEAKQQGGTELIWEELVDLVSEVSIIATRGQDGSIVTYPIGENIHRNNILYRSIVPATLQPELVQQAIDIVTTIGNELAVVGTFTVELFIVNTEDGLTLYFNEIAPRPHNSGHYSIEGCITSQFENQLRAVCGLPLGDTALRSPAVLMQNILGDGNGNTLAGVDQLLSQPGVYPHLYGKAEAKANRKMGHTTVVGDSIEAVVSMADSIDSTIHWT